MIKKLENISLKFTGWIGTVGSLIFHTLLFGAAFALRWLGVSLDEILLVLTTIVSLEAIYLAIFIQMTVNKNLRHIEEISTDVDELSEDVEEISKDVDEISEDIEEISSDVDKMQEEENKCDIEEQKTQIVLTKIEERIQKILVDIESLKQQK